MTKIENMIDLRLRCLELALDFYEDGRNYSTKDIKDCAENFASFILGDSELPKSPISLNDIINNYALKMVNDSEKQKVELEKLKETLANSKQE